ncbi:ubiquitin carboxyl-terminal hydrolase isozyme L3-like isoform X2 [Zophobas morio]|uniref:ubiquitin carboxyl-terminal hydrolase isozyme L3-like isoform X2 n=1 Tax=Zophobas morio TaxID=2755281 RepID=UPI0030838F86
MAVWLPLESSPEVMSRYLKKLGVEGVEVCDIYSLEEDALFLIPEPVYGIILLFPMTEKYKKLGAGKEASLEKPDKLVFFVKQTILNACGSLALTHVILNNYDKIKFSECGVMEKFYHTTLHLDPNGRARKSFAALHHIASLEGQTSLSSTAAVDGHFVAFVKVKNVIYELDGRKQFPVSYGITQESSFKSMIKAVKTFMDQDADFKNFSLLAIIQMSKATLDANLKALAIKNNRTLLGIE